MADVGGRIREGKPPKLWSKFWTWFPDTGHRGGGFRWLRRHSADPLKKCSSDRHRMSWNSLDKSQGPSGGRESARVPNLLKQHRCPKEPRKRTECIWLLLARTCWRLLFFAGVCCYLPLSIFFCNFFLQTAHKKGPDLQNGCTMTRTWLQDGSLDRFGTSRRALEAASFTFFFVTFRSATLGPQSESGVITKHFLGRKLFALAPPTKATGGLKALRL